MKERITTLFYVYGNTPQETRDPEWSGEAKGFTVIHPTAGLFVADGLDIRLNNGHAYVALKLRELPYWLVGERNPEQKGLSLQQFILIRDQLLFLDKADSQDWKALASLWRFPTVPWKCLARYMEFCSSMPALMLQKRQDQSQKTAA